MTYVAQYFHAFSASDKFGTAGRRVGNLGQTLQQAWEMQNDYELRARSLLESITAAQANWKQSKAHSLSAARQLLKEFEAHKATTKRTWLSERQYLDTVSLANSSCLVTFRPS